MKTIPKQSPLYATTQDLGADFGELGGWKLPEKFAPVEEELKGAREGVAMMDVSGNGKIMIEGEGLAPLFPAEWNVSNLDINKGIQFGANTIYRLRADQFFVNTPPGGETEVIEVITESRKQMGGLISITDFTHGRAEIQLLGPMSPELLSRLCGLDFYDAAFPNLHAKQSSVAKTSQLILRNDIHTLRAYSLIGDRSLAAYLWETTIKAGKDLGIVPLGLEAFSEI